MAVRGPVARARHDRAREPAIPRSPQVARGNWWSVIRFGSSCKVEAALTNPDPRAGLVSAQFYRVASPVGLRARWPRQADRGGACAAPASSRLLQLALRRRVDPLVDRLVAHPQSVIAWTVDRQPGDQPFSSSGSTAARSRGCPSSLRARGHRRDKTRPPPGDQVVESGTCGRPSDPRTRVAETQGVDHPDSRTRRDADVLTQRGWPTTVTWTPIWQPGRQTTYT